MTARFYLVTRLVRSVKSFTVCPTACDIGDGFVAKETLAAEILRPPLFIYGSIFVIFSKREFHLAACAFEKTASFRTQLSTYSRRFITSVEHENSVEHEISDLSTYLSLSLSTVYNLMPIILFTVTKRRGCIDSSRNNFILQHT